MIAKQIGENAIFSHNVTELRGERKREREGCNKSSGI